MITGIMVTLGVVILLSSVLPRSTGQVYVQETREQLINKMINQALYDASMGDAKARDWITKHALNNKSVAAEPNKGTSEAIVNDAIAALQALGYKKQEATARVNKSISQKKYSNLETLLQDSM